MLLLTFLFTFSVQGKDPSLIESPIPHSKHSNEVWTKLDQSKKDRFKRLFYFLKESKTGKELLAKADERARSQGVKLYDVLSEGEHSLTDTTLVRSFSAEHPEKVSYELKAHVSINKHLKVVDAVLDLAHELTHYAYRGPFNPYDTTFSMAQFVRSTIEGTGGEVMAYLKECQVLSELFPEKIQTQSHCRRVTDGEGLLSRSKTISEFYRIGQYHAKIGVSLLPELPQLSPAEPFFISSAYGVPYPVAAMKEYQQVMTKVCENDYRRLQMMKASGLEKNNAVTRKISAFTSQLESRCEFR